MMKTFLMAMLGAVVLVTGASFGEETAPPARERGSIAASSASFLRPGEWWNLFFAEGSNPLGRSVAAVKIAQVSPSRPSWVQITFPSDRDEHMSIFGPAARAHDDESVDIEAALSEWEKSITSWKTIWINLAYVVHAGRVEPNPSE